MRGAKCEEASDGAQHAREDKLDGEDIWAVRVNDTCVNDTVGDGNRDTCGDRFGGTLAPHVREELADGRDDARAAHVVGTRGLEESNREKSDTTS